ncbi:substrate-binding domain-containing protein [Prosthecobacter sp. SYSU 5D2]|uniref:substrate-binding domain-containing protein n=1 Tax=Prosthecobacter sp. SYSU 5D2 TaxID=3134134 RepID=UPI0031FEC95F
MKNRRRIWLMGLFLCLGMMTACKRAARPEVVEDSSVVVFLSAHGDRMYENGQRLLFARLMTQDPRFRLQTLDAGSQVETQVSQMKAALQEKPLAILIDALDARSLKTLVSDALSAGVLVIGLGEGSADLDCSTVLVADQRKLGELAGQLAVRALLLKNQEEGRNEAAGRVIEIRGDDESVQCQQRHEGFEAALAEAPGVILVHDAPGGWSLAGGRDRALDALRLQQSYDIVYAHNDVMAFGASLALAQKEVRNEVMVIGTDGFRGTEGGMTLVGDGEIDATLYQPLLVDFAWVLLRKKLEDRTFRPKPRYDMPLRTIQPKDLDEIRLNGLPPHPEL